MTTESILEPELPIVDAHHHLWYLPQAMVAAISAQENVAAKAVGNAARKYPRYLFDEFKADVETGHNIVATVFVNARTMYRATGPEAMKSLGEVEFVNGVAAMGYSGLFGNTRYCAGIVSSVDLTLGDAVPQVLRAHKQAAGARYCGIRGAGTAYDEDTKIMGAGGVANRLLDARFRDGFKWLQELNLAFDAFVLEPQLPDLIDLARAFPQTAIILNHAGLPLGVGRYEGKRDERFVVWRENMRTLSRSENVTVKLGGFGTPFAGFNSYMATPPRSSAQLAEEWQPYIHTCIELFGAHRCMFESNFPVDGVTCSYPVLWNAFKRLAAGATADEKNDLFSRTAIRVYRLEI